MGNAELKWKVARRATLTVTFRIPHSAFRIMHHVAHPARNRSSATASTMIPPMMIS